MSTTATKVQLAKSATEYPMGCHLTEAGASFKVWAPHADEVSVVGSFNDWEKSVHPMEREGDLWFAHVDDVKAGERYKFHIRNRDNEFTRNDPYAREVTNSVGEGVVVDQNFDWGEDAFELPNHNELVIYEMHVGTFNRPEEDEVGEFSDVSAKLDYLVKLGVNAIQLMPSAEFAGDISWGYNPAHIFAVESAYGGPNALKQLVKDAHQRGIGVIMDVVYNHFGPSDLDLWQFDGWGENDKGGIYFYNDWRSSTPWGETRPDYGRGEVRLFIHDNAMMWMDEFRMDGLRYDMTLYMRSVDGDESRSIPEGWSLAQWVNREIHKRHPRAITIAEDLRSNPGITKPEDHGGANFSTQWDQEFVHPIRAVVTTPVDDDRCMETVRHALNYRYNLDSFERVVYSESHDEVANGKSRVTSEIDEKDPESLFAQKRSTLAAALVFTAPGIPMIFQGQEFLRDSYFDDTRPIDWDQEEEYRGIVRMYRDLIRLRLNRDDMTAGLTGQHIEVSHVNNQEKVVSFRRWRDGGAGDNTVVIANFANRGWDDYRIGLVYPGEWKLLFNSNAQTYSKDFYEFPADDADAQPHEWDGLPYSASISIAPYSVLIYSQTKS